MDHGRSSRLVLARLARPGFGIVVLLARVADDRLPTPDAIVVLRLKAGWIVPSACNTASGQGAGSEAVTKLGLAFFCAGARALLVSGWPVGDEG